VFDWSGFEFGFGPGVTPSQAVSAPGFYAPAPVVIPDPTKPVDVLGPPVVPDPTKPVNVLGPSAEQIAKQAEQNSWAIIDKNNREIAAQQEAMAEQQRLEREKQSFQAYVDTVNDEEAEADRLFKEEQARLAAEAAARLRLDEEAFARAQSELDALFQQERQEIERQASEYQAMQQRLQEQAEAERVRLEAEQRALQEERVRTEAQAAAAAEENRRTLEGFQREGAEREVARRRVTRSTVSRPLLAGLSDEKGPQTLGYGGAFAGGGGLGGASTLGVA
jgi:hypothetical protein